MLGHMKLLAAASHFLDFEKSEPLVGAGTYEIIGRRFTLFGL